MFNFENTIIGTLLFYSFLFQGAKLLNSIIDTIFCFFRKEFKAPFENEALKNETILFYIAVISFLLYERKQIFPLPLVFILVRSIVYFINLIMYDIEESKTKKVFTFYTLTSTIISLTFLVTQLYSK